MSDSIQADIQRAEQADAEQLLAFIANRDVPCPACGYNLRMLSKSVCPECGLALKLTVGSDEPFKRLWAFTLIINSLIAGIGLLFAMLFVFNSYFREYVGERFVNFLNPEQLFFLIGWLGPILWMPIPLLLFWQRRRFSRMKSKVQRILMLVSIGWLIVQSIATFSIFNN